MIGVTGFGLFFTPTFYVVCRALGDAAVTPHPEGDAGPFRSRRSPARRMKAKPMKRALLSSLSALTLAACAAGPNYVAPIPAPKATASSIGAGQPGVAATATDDHWWRLYDDPVLDGLVADALKANTDIRVAVARLDAARASLRGVRNDRLPQTSIGTDTGYGRLPASQRFPGAAREDASVDIGLNVS